MEKTLVLIKPDGVKNKHIGDIIDRFEQRGFKIAALKMFRMTREQASYHYSEHAGKNFYEPLLAYIMSGPIVAIVLQGPNAIKAVRTMMGHRNPLEALPGTIRGDFALDVANNVIHGSDSPQSAEREIGNIFNSSDVY